MAYADYIHCAECDCKLIYDGDCNARDILDSRHPGGWSLLCPECITTLRTAVADATERAGAAEAKLKVPGGCGRTGEIVERARRYQHGVSNLSAMLSKASIAVSEHSGNRIHVGFEFAEVRNVLDWLNAEAYRQEERADALAARLAEVDDREHPA